MVANRPWSGIDHLNGGHLKTCLCVKVTAPSWEIPGDWGRVVKSGFMERSDFNRISSHKTHLPKQTFPPDELISDAKRSFIIPGWQPFSATIHPKMFLAIRWSICILNGLGILYPQVVSLSDSSLLTINRAQHFTEYICSSVTHPLGMFVYILDISSELCKTFIQNKLHQIVLH